MDVVLGLVANVFQEGLLYGVMAIGVYITYQVLNFPDLSVEGTFALGACLTGAMISVGISPWIACLASLVCGAAAGGVTGLLHVKLHITDLLSGILVMISLWSVNLVITNGSAVLAYYNKPTVFTSGPAALIPSSMADLRILAVAFVFCAAVKILIDLYLRTKSGLLLRAAGGNPQFVVSLGRDPGNLKILGLMIGNGLTALSGSILCQREESADISSGTGMIVMGLAAVIIGVNLFGRLKFLRPTTAVVLGALVYRACLSAAMQIGLPTNFLKLLMAVLFTAALVMNNFAPQSGRRKKQDVNPTRL